MSPLVVHSHRPARRPSPVTQPSSFTACHVRGPVAKIETHVCEPWQTFALHDPPLEPGPGPQSEWSSFVMFDEASDTFKSHPESRRIKQLRFDEAPSIAQPYHPTALPVCSSFRLGGMAPNPSPLRHVALANVAQDALGTGDSTDQSNSQRRPRRKKAVSFGETIQILVIDADTAVEAQAWAHYPEQAKCKVWDGQSDGPCTRRPSRRRLNTRGCRTEGENRARRWRAEARLIASATKVTGQGEEAD